MEILKTYVGNYGGNIAPSTAIDPVWRVVCQTRRYLLKTVIWQIYLNTTAPVVRVPLSENNIMNYWLCIGTGLVAGKVAFSFTPVTAPNPVVTDRRVSIFEPGQYFFDGLYFQNIIDFYLHFENLDAVNTIAFATSVTAEIYEIEE